MSIQSIANGITSSVSKSLTLTKNAALWGCRSVKSGFSNYLVPAIKSVWSGFVHLNKSIASFLRSGPGLLFTASAGLLALGLAALKTSNNEEYIDSEHKLSKATWKTIGMASIASSVAVAAAGVFLLF